MRSKIGGETGLYSFFIEMAWIVSLFRPGTFTLKNFAYPDPKDNCKLRFSHHDKLLLLDLQQQNSALAITSRDRSAWQTKPLTPPLADSPSPPLTTMNNSLFAWQSGLAALGCTVHINFVIPIVQKIVCRCYFSISFFNKCHRVFVVDWLRRHLRAR